MAIYLSLNLSFFRPWGAFETLQADAPPPVDFRLVA